MLAPNVVRALNDYVSAFIRDLPTMKEKYMNEFEAGRDFGFGGVGDLVHIILHDIRHESVMVFARNSNSQMPNDRELQEMVKVIDRRASDITLAVQDWIRYD